MDRQLITFIKVIEQLALLGNPYAVVVLAAMTIEMARN
jgi:hypothetical protein